MKANPNHELNGNEDANKQSCQVRFTYLTVYFVPFFFWYLFRAVFLITYFPLYPMHHFTEFFVTNSFGYGLTTRNADAILPPLIFVNFVLTAIFLSTFDFSDCSSGIGPSASAEWAPHKTRQGTVH